MTSTQTKRQKLATSTVSSNNNSTTSNADTEPNRSPSQPQQRANEQSPTAAAACPKAELTSGQPAITNNHHQPADTKTAGQQPATRASSRRGASIAAAAAATTTTTKQASSATRGHFGLEVDELGEEDGGEDEDDEDEDDDDDEDEAYGDPDEDDEEEDEDDDETEDSADSADSDNGGRRKKSPLKRHNGGQHLASSKTRAKASTNSKTNAHANSTNKANWTGGSQQQQQQQQQDQLQANIQEQLAASGPAGVAAAAAIATARKRKRAHTFETNPSVRKRQQTRLIRKLRQCIDEYTARVGQQAVVLITMPGKAANNFKVFGAQPLESVVRACKQEIMLELEQAVLEQTPMKVADQEASGKHELPPLVIDGIPTPVEKMTQAQLRAFIPLMLKYSTGRGKPGWGKESTRPPWWPGTLPWANVRSDARDEDEKQRISWTTTLREIVTNCYTYHGREDLLPKFDESAAGAEDEAQHEPGVNGSSSAAAAPAAARAGNKSAAAATRPLGSASTRSSQRLIAQHHQQQQHQLIAADQLQHLYTTTVGGGGGGASASAYGAPADGQPFMHTIQNPDGSVSLIQVDPANAQILTLPDGTQVRAVRLQTLASNEHHHHHHHQQLMGSSELHHNAATACLDPSGQTVTLQLAGGHHPDQQLSIAAEDHEQQQQQQQLQEGQIILTSEDGTQSCYPMSSLVSIPASVYQQFAATGQPIQIVATAAPTAGGGAAALADGAQLVAGLHSLQEISAAEAQLVEQQQQQQQQQVEAMEEQQEQAAAAAKGDKSSESGGNQAAAAAEQANDNQDQKLLASKTGD